MEAPYPLPTVARSQRGRNPSIFWGGRGESADVGNGLLSVSESGGRGLGCRRAGGGLSERS